MPGEADRDPMRRRLRRRRVREALLLDLGALVYELHRQGKRAPELLQQKAGELSAVDDEVRGSEEAPHLSTCPQCGEPAERGQLACTTCGARLALDDRRPHGAVPALAVLLGVVVIGAGAFGFALSEITSDSEPEVSAADRRERPAPAAAAPEAEPQATTRGQEGARAGTSAGGAPQRPRRRLLLEWPRDLTAHTVVLVTTSDRSAARRLARDAARSGIEAGLLRSDHFNLGTGLWIVFAGRFDTREGAVRQAANLADRFPGAYPQLVEPAG